MKDSLANICNDPFKLNGTAFFAEIGTAFISGIGVKKSSVGGEDFVGDKPQEFNNFHKDMEYVII